MAGERGIQNPWSMPASPSTSSPSHSFSSASAPISAPSAPRSASVLHASLAAATGSGSSSGFNNGNGNGNSAEGGSGAAPPQGPAGVAIKKESWRPTGPATSSWAPPGPAGAAVKGSGPPAGPSALYPNRRRSPAPSAPTGPAAHIYPSSSSSSVPASAAGGGGGGGGGYGPSSSTYQPTNNTYASTPPTGPGERRNFRTGPANRFDRLESPGPGMIPSGPSSLSAGERGRDGRDPPRGPAMDQRDDYRRDDRERDRIRERDRDRDRVRDGDRDRERDRDKQWGPGPGPGPGPPNGPTARIQSNVGSRDERDHRDYRDRIERERRDRDRDRDRDSDMGMGMDVDRERPRDGPRDFGRDSRDGRDGRDADRQSGRYESYRPITSEPVRRPWGERVQPPGPPGPAGPRGDVLEREREREAFDRRRDLRDERDDRDPRDIGRPHPDRAPIIPPGARSNGQTDRFGPGQRGDAGPATRGIGEGGRGRRESPDYTRGRRASPDYARGRGKSGSVSRSRSRSGSSGSREKGAGSRPAGRRSPSNSRSPTTRRPSLSPTRKRPPPPGLATDADRAPSAKRRKASPSARSRSRSSSRLARSRSQSRSPISSRPGQGANPAASVRGRSRSRSIPRDGEKERYRARQSGGQGAVSDSLPYGSPIRGSREVEERDLRRGGDRDDDRPGGRRGARSRSRSRDVRPLPASAGPGPGERFRRSSPVGRDRDRGAGRYRSPDRSNGGWYRAVDRGPDSHAPGYRPGYGPGPGAGSSAGSGARPPPPMNGMSTNRRRSPSPPLSPYSASPSRPTRPPRPAQSGRLHSDDPRSGTTTGAHGAKPLSGVGTGAGGAGPHVHPDRAFLRRSPSLEPLHLPYDDDDQTSQTGRPNQNQSQSQGNVQVKRNGDDRQEEEQDHRIPPPRHPLPATYSPVAPAPRGGMGGRGGGGAQSHGDRREGWDKRRSDNRPGPHHTGPGPGPGQPGSQGQHAAPAVHSGGAYPDGTAHIANNNLNGNETARGQSYHGTGTGAQSVPMSKNRSGSVSGSGSGSGIGTGGARRQSWASRAVPEGPKAEASGPGAGEGEGEGEGDMDVDMDMEIEADTPPAAAPLVLANSGTSGPDTKDAIPAAPAALTHNPIPNAAAAPAYIPPGHSRPPFPPTNPLAPPGTAPILPPFPPNTPIYTLTPTPPPPAVSNGNGIHGVGIKIDFSTVPRPPAAGHAPVKRASFGCHGGPGPKVAHTPGGKVDDDARGRAEKVRSVFDASREGTPDSMSAAEEVVKGAVGIGGSGIAQQQDEKRGEGQKGIPTGPAQTRPAVMPSYQPRSAQAQPPPPPSRSTTNGVNGSVPLHPTPPHAPSTQSVYVPRNPPSQSSALPPSAPAVANATMTTPTVPAAPTPSPDVPPAPYIRAAFEQWYAQTEPARAQSQPLPPLPSFLGHFFGRDATDAEIKAVEGLWMRKQAATRTVVQSVPPPASHAASTAPGSTQAIEADDHSGASNRSETAVTTLPPGEVYERLACVGEGTYGKVYKAKNVYSNAFVALKRIRMEGEKEGFPVTAMREIKLLQGLRHRNVIRLVEMMVSKGSVYMVFEYMELDLTGLLAHPDISFTPANIKSLTYQMLDGLAYLHDMSILHRDLKGSNILLSSTGVLKLADFGLARFYNKRARDDYTNRVITLWYRSPELLLGETVYQGEVDMWSAGCIALELFITKPVFQGQDEITQLQVIWDILGTPDSHAWASVEELPWYELVRPKQTIPDRFESSFTKWLPTSNAMDLVKGMLALDPARRVTAVQAMRHEYFREEPKGEVPDMRGMGEWHEMDAKLSRRKKEGR